jgi:hypothetical protein
MSILFFVARQSQQLGSIHRRIPADKNSLGFDKMNLASFNQSEDLALTQSSQQGGGPHGQHLDEGVAPAAKSFKTAPGFDGGQLLDFINNFGRSFHALSEFPMLLSVAQRD